MRLKHQTPNFKLQTRYPFWNLGFGNWQFLSGGFTLLEFLVVIGLLSITIGSILLFLTSVLKGTNQANITSEVKQNGQVVLDTLESQIRNATDADCMLESGNDCLDVKLIRVNTDPLRI